MSKVTHARAPTYLAACASIFQNSERPRSWPRRLLPLAPARLTIPCWIAIRRASSATRVFSTTTSTAAPSTSCAPTCVGSDPRWPTAALLVRPDRQCAGAGALNRPTGPARFATSAYPSTRRSRCPVGRRPLIPSLDSRHRRARDSRGGTQGHLRQGGQRDRNASARIVGPLLTAQYSGGRPCPDDRREGERRPEDL